MHIMAQDVKVKIAGGGSTGTGAIWTPIAVDCSGYDRAEVVVARGAQAGATKGNVYASVYESTATGGTYAVISGSNGTAGTAKSNMALLIYATSSIVICAGLSIMGSKDRIILL